MRKRRARSKTPSIWCKGLELEKFQRVDLSHTVGHATRPNRECNCQGTNFSPFFQRAVTAMRTALQVTITVILSNLNLKCCRFGHAQFLKQFAHEDRFSLGCSNMGGVLWLPACFPLGWQLIATRIDVYDILCNLKVS